MADGFRIAPDSESLLKEINEKNNVAVVKTIKFTGKEYLGFVAPTP